METELIVPRRHNLDAPLLRQYASEQGDALVASCGVPNARYGTLVFCCLEYGNQESC